jgi:signal transduction histidine kinase
LPDDVELALFRVVQESLTNIYRHAESATATIRLTQRLGQVILTVADQGHGLPPGLRDTVNSSGALVGVGLAGMRERVRQLGGRLEIESAMPGTTITVVLPAGGERA